MITLKATWVRKEKASLFIFSAYWRGLIFPLVAICVYWSGAVKLHDVRLCPLKRTGRTSCALRTWGTAYVYVKVEINVTWMSIFPLRIETLLISRWLAQDCQTDLSNFDDCISIPSWRCFNSDTKLKMIRFWFFNFDLSISMPSWRPFNFDDSFSSKIDFSFVIIFNFAQMDLPKIVSIQNCYSLLNRVDYETGLLEVCSPQNTNVGLRKYPPVTDSLCLEKGADCPPASQRSAQCLTNVLSLAQSHHSTIHLLLSSEQTEVPSGLSRSQCITNASISLET